MLKLYKLGEGVSLYWEAWEARREIVIHWGTVGEKGETQVLKIGRGQAAAVIIEREAAAPLARGFRQISNRSLHRIILQYPAAGVETPEDLEKRHRIEDVMNEVLGWFGLGHCDGGDIGSGTINIYCFVVDVGKSVEAMIEELRRKDLLKGAVIASSSATQDTILWPQDSSKTFSLFGTH